MVTSSRTAIRPDRVRALGRQQPLTGHGDRLQPLNQPRAVAVRCASDTGLPCSVGLRDGRVDVAEVLDMWLVEDEWWRAPVARRYVHLALSDGRPLTLFEDTIAGRWYLQRYSSVGSMSTG